MMIASKLLKSCARPPVNWPTASIFCDWRNCARCVSISRRSVTSRTMPTKAWLPASGDSPTASSIGKVEPSLRRPITSRPVPMIFATPVARYAVM